MSSLSRNFLYNVFHTLSGIVFPIITFSYISRVLGPVGIGKYQFVDSLTRFLILISALGVPVYGVREVSKLMGDIIKEKKLFTELFSVNVVLTFVMLLAYYCFALTLDKYYSDPLLFHVGALLILSGAFNVSWYFKGLEQFKSLTMITVLLRCVSIASVFVFVHQKEDYTIYFFLLCISTFVTNLIIWQKSLKRIGGISFRNIDLKFHVKPLLMLFSTQVVISIYAMLDTVMLGLLSTDEATGLYGAAVKINKIMVAVVSSFGVVLLPKVSQFLKMGDMDAFSSIIQNTLYFVLLVSVPVMVGLMVTAEELLFIFSGAEFVKAATSMKVIAPITLFIGLGNIFCLQILIPSNLENKMLIAVSVGALLNVTINLLLIPHYQHLGAAVGTFIAECCVASLTFLFARRFITKGLNFSFLLQLSLTIFLFFIVGYVADQYLNGYLLKLSVKVISCLLIYTVFVFLSKDNNVVNLRTRALNVVLKKIRKY